MFVGRSFFDVRPAGFSNLLVAVFLLILVLATYRNILYIWFVVPVVVFWCNVHGGYIYAFIMFVPFVALNLLTSVSKKKFVSIGLKGVYHTIAAGFVAFIGTILFNPFHLTNLTHTFVVSVSRHAEKWRTVNEWHPAFEWRNPVGTSFPFLVLYVLSMGLTLFWLYSRFLKPKLLRARASELEAQRSTFTTLSKIFGWAAAVFICWVTFIGFSFLNLDALSFLICAVFVLILLLSIYKSVHCVYLVVPLVLLALWSADPGAGYTGRYIYPFILLPVYVIIHILVSLLSKTVKIKPLNVVFPAATAVVTLFLIVAIFNPFKFGSLFTVESKFHQGQLDNRLVSEQLRKEFVRNKTPLLEDVAASVKKPGNKWLITDGAKKYTVRREKTKLNIYKFGSPVWQMHKVFHLRRVWIPRYEGKYRVTYTHLFTTLYIINIALVVVWLVIPYLQTVLRQPQNKTDQEPKADVYELPKIDLALMAIAALTIYMAIRSRRFIPIAAIAACPVLAMFIDQMARTISAACGFHGLLFNNASQNQTPRRQNRLVVPPLSRNLQAFFAVLGLVAVVGFGTWWTLKFKCVYLDPWPTDPKLSSVFMRMTASDAKPFWALKFINDNKLEGKMFNYWTEGGFIGWGQDPDPNTGKTRLQLFMDGRAQAAYMRRTYDIWSEIMFGGPPVQKVRNRIGARKGKFTRDDYREVGQWIDKQLRRWKVWIVMMPAGQFSVPFVRGLEHNPNWRLIFFNNKQKLFVDVRTPQADKLFKGINDGKTLYPDEFSRNLIIAHILFGKRQSVEQALDLAIKAFKLNPSQAPIHKIVYAAAGHKKLIPRINKFCEEYVNDFEKNKDDWAKKDGYHNRIVAALVAIDYLRNIARKQNNKKLLAEYSAKRRQYGRERSAILKTKRW
ncbi:MAG: hypothetical protein ACYSWR_04850 [Planctomycetota bacterium]